MAFMAQYRGVCEDCFRPVEVGDLVFYAGSELVHKVCPAEWKVVICDRCFLTKPCGCDDA